MKKTKLDPLVLLAKYTVSEMNRNTYPDKDVATFLSGWFSHQMVGQSGHVYLVVDISAEDAEVVTDVYPKARQAVKQKKLLEQAGVNATVVKL